MPPHLNPFVQGVDDPRGRQAGVDLDAQSFSVVFVDHIECSEAPTRP